MFIIAAIKVIMMIDLRKIINTIIIQNYLKISKRIVRYIVKEYFNLCYNRLKIKIINM